MLQFAPLIIAGTGLDALLEAHLKYLEHIGADLRPSQPSPDPTLSPFLRALLVADGTVTLLLSAYFNEVIRVETLRQMSAVMPGELELLDLHSGDEVFYREVKLLGASTGDQYASAVSLINPNALDPELFGQLIDENVGMGEVLRNSARGSYREVLDIGEISSDQVRRTYTVFLNGQPAILITEQFNAQLF